MDHHEAYRDLFDKEVIIDMDVPSVYIGRLVEANEHFLTVADADVHALGDSTVTKEVYVMGVRRNGIQPTRKLVKVKQAKVLSISLLEDIILY